MSADNWAKCPRCIKNHEAEITEREAAIAAAYGSVSVEQFDMMRASVDTLRKQVDDYDFLRTFREDYEFYGVEEGSVTADYRGGCSKCGLRLEFEHTHTLDVAGEIA